MVSDIYLGPFREGRTYCDVFANHFIEDFHRDIIPLKLFCIIFNGFFIK